MRIISANISGINAAKKAGFFTWPHIAAADILCLQETQADDVEEMGRYLGYHAVAADRGLGNDSRKAHGGVAIFSRSPLADIVRSGVAHVKRGQFVSCSIGSLRLASIYVTLDANRDQFAAFSKCFSNLLASSPTVMIAGDFNTFRGQQDSWRFHDAMSRQEVGTDDHARNWLEGLFKEGWVDVTRLHLKRRPFHTWWHSEGNFLKNQGTRLDYIFASPALAPSAIPESATIYPEQRRGGHAQLAISIGSMAP
jgi:exodeoxyribonuclease-3